MYDVIEIATCIVISEWHTEKEAQEQVDRFNKSANGEYYEVRKLIIDNEYKQKYENLIDKIQNIRVSQRFLKSELNHPNFNIRQVVEREIYARLMNELKKHCIEFKEIDEDDTIRLVASIKVIKNEDKN